MIISNLKRYRFKDHSSYLLTLKMTPSITLLNGFLNKSLSPIRYGRSPVKAEDEF